MAYFNVRKTRTIKIFGIPAVPVYMPNGHLPSRNEKQRFWVVILKKNSPFINTLETK